MACLLNCWWPLTCVGIWSCSLLCSHSLNLFPPLWIPPSVGKVLCDYPAPLFPVLICFHSSWFPQWVETVLWDYPAALTCVHSSWFPQCGNSALGPSQTPISIALDLTNVWEHCTGTIQQLCVPTALTCFHSSWFHLCVETVLWDYPTALTWFHSSWFPQCVGILHWDYPTALCTHSPNLFPLLLIPPVYGASALGL